MAESGKVNTWTDRYRYLSILQHFIAFAAAFELTDRVLGNICEGLSFSATAVHQKSQKTSNSEQRNTKNKNCDGASIHEVASCAQS